MNIFKSFVSLTVIIFVSTTVSFGGYCPEDLGFVSDGKSYFADMKIRRNWTEAGKYCHKCNLMLAAISSPQQKALLHLALAKNSVIEQYWTSARENRHTLASLVWNASTQVVEEGIFDGFADATGGVGPNPYQNCGMFEVNREYAIMAIKPCRHLLGTLCVRKPNYIQFGKGLNAVYSI